MSTEDEDAVRKSSIHLILLGLHSFSHHEIRYCWRFQDFLTRDTLWPHRSCGNVNRLKLVIRTCLEGFDQLGAGERLQLHKMRLEMIILGLASVQFHRQRLQ